MSPRGRLRRCLHGRLAAPELERTFLPLAHLAPPHLAVLVVARQDRGEAEAARVVAHFLLADLVDHRFDLMSLERRHMFIDPVEELVIAALQPPNVFLELVELVVLFDHAGPKLTQSCLNRPPGLQIPRCAAFPRWSESFPPRPSRPSWPNMD